MNWGSILLGCGTKSYYDKNLPRRVEDHVYIHISRTAMM